MEQTWRSLYIYKKLTPSYIFLVFSHFSSHKLISIFLISQIMTTQQRKDLHMNIPALRKLDAMLIVIKQHSIID